MGTRHLLVVLFCLAASPARADELALSMEVDGCAPLALQDEIESALGRPLAPGEPVLRARVAVRRSGRRIRVVVGMDRDGARSERTLDLANCAAAGRALALVIALALDPSLDPFGEPPSVVPTAAPPVEDLTNDAAVPEAALVELSFAVEVEPEPREEPSALEPPPTDEGPALHATVNAGALIEAGALPGTNAGATAAFGLRFDALVVELAGTYLAEARAFAAEPGASAALTLGYATLRAGVAAPPLGPMVLGAAAELDAGAMRGAASGARVQAEDPAWLPWVSLRGALYAELWLSAELALRATGSAGGALSAPRFEIAGLGPVYAATALLVAGTLSVVVRLV